MRGFLLKVVDVLFPPCPKKPYPGCICDVCGETVKGGDKANHVKQEHPEVPLRTELHYPETYYYCTICNKTIGSVSRVIKHYREVHKGKPSP